MISGGPSLREDLKAILKLVEGMMIEEEDQEIKVTTTGIVDHLMAEISEAESGGLMIVAETTGITDHLIEGVGDRRHPLSGGDLPRVRTAIEEKVVDLGLRSSHHWAGPGRRG